MTTPLKALGLVLALTLAPTVAAASPNYPDAVQAAAGSPCPPPCTVCHESSSGGYGTAVKPFARAMAKIGKLDAEDSALVAPAIEALKAQATDSDGDGTGDVAEVAAGNDPNRHGDGDLCGPEYGCGARIEPGQRVDGWALLLSVLVALSLVARGRRR